MSYLPFPCLQDSSDWEVFQLVVGAVCNWKEYIIYTNVQKYSVILTRHGLACIFLTVWHNLAFPLETRQSQVWWCVTVFFLNFCPLCHCFWNVLITPYIACFRENIHILVVGLCSFTFHKSMMSREQIEISYIIQMIVAMCRGPGHTSNPRLLDYGQVR